MTDKEKIKCLYDCIQLKMQTANKDQRKAYLDVVSMILILED